MNWAGYDGFLKTLDIHLILRREPFFQKRLEAVKNANRSTEFGWYPYNSFGVFSGLTSMLREERRELLALAGAAPVLDVGSGMATFPSSSNRPAALCWQSTIAMPISTRLAASGRFTRR